jgi:hypothetical protein
MVMMVRKCRPKDFADGTFSPAIEFKFKAITNVSGGCYVMNVGWKISTRIGKNL